jgi:hypothetical protein
MSAESQRDAGRPPGGRDRIGAVPRGPTSVFVYWDLQGEPSRDAVHQVGPGAEWVLRVLNLTERETISIPVEVESGNHYLEVTAGQTYGFELAVRGTGGKWRTVCRTGRVAIPPAGPATSQARPSPAAPRATPRGEGAPLAARGIAVPGLDAQTTPPPGGASRGASGQPPQ